MSVLGVYPLNNNTNRLQMKTLRMFKYLLKGSLDDIVSNYEISIESITETYDINVDGKLSNSVNNTNQKSFVQLYEKLKGHIVTVMLIVSVLLLFIPIFVINSSILSDIKLNTIVAERKSIIVNLNFYSFETLIQSKSFPPGVSELYLMENIKKIENIQKQLYIGTLGMESTTKLRYLDSLLMEYHCLLDEEECEAITDEPITGYTKNMVKGGLNALIDEYVDKAKTILYQSNLKKCKSYDFIYKPLTTPIGISMMISVQNPEVSFQIYTMNHILGGLTKFSNIMYDNVQNTIKTIMLYIFAIFMITGGFVSGSFFITFKIILNTKKVLRELVNIVFLVPQSTVNMVPQFKRFIETGSFEEE